MIDYSKVIYTTNNKVYDQGLRSYMLKVYNYMAMALMLTFLSAVCTLYFSPLTNLIFNITYDGYIVNMTNFGLFITFLPLIIALYFFFEFAKMTVQTAQILFYVYSITIGISLSSLGLIYTGTSIIKTFFICSSIFGIMSLYGYNTQRDLTSIGSFLFMGLLGIFIASLINIFFHSSAIEFAVSIIGIIVFTGLIAWDAQKIKNMYYYTLSSTNEEYAQKVAIIGALNIYVDFINLFIHLIRFLGNRKQH